MSTDDPTTVVLHKSPDSVTNGKSRATTQVAQLKTLNNNKLLNGEQEGEQLLGSTFLPNDATENGHGLRASARVIHKIRMDSMRQPSPPPPPAVTKETEAKRADHKNPKTPSQPKASNKVVWSNAEKNMFFEALNEYGKDFEAIATYINNKQKRRNVTENFFKSKEQVRFLFFQFLQKASKYLKFSDEVKKNVQELYALINYGEMRKKIVFLQSDKVFFKLHDLVYKGSITLRIKGKNIKIKTPSCRALRKLNQLEEWQEEIKLPPRIDVILKPATVESWGRVQALAQNPRIRTQVPLQRRISALLTSLQYRWRCQDIRLQEKLMALVPNPQIKGKHKPPLPPTSAMETIKDAMICFAPPTDVRIHRPVVHLSEFLSSDSICLNAYEQRIGVKVSGSTLGGGAMGKRQRHDSEKKLLLQQQQQQQQQQEKSPEQKKLKVEDVEVTEPKTVQELLLSPNSSSRDSLVDRNEIPRTIEILDFKDAEMLSDVDVDFTSTAILSSDEAAKEEKPDEGEVLNCDKKTFEIGKIRTKKSRKKEVKPSNFKPLISEEVMKEIREGWTMKNAGDLTFGDLYVMFGAESKLHLEYSWVNPQEVTAETEQPEVKKVRFENVKNAECVSDKLKQLLQLAQLSDKLKRKPTCSCGHICKKSQLDGVLSPVQNGEYFKHPPLRRNLTYSPSGDRTKQLFGRPRTRPLFPTKQIIVQRFLPVKPGMNQTYGVLSSDGSLKKPPVTSTRSIDVASTTPPTTNGSQSQQHQVTITSTDGEVSQILSAKMKQLTEERAENHSTDSFGSFMELSLPEYGNTPLMSPMGILRESPVDNSYNVEDVSLSSILGQLENACDIPAESKSESKNADMPVLNNSVDLTEFEMDE